MSTILSAPWNKGWSLGLLVGLGLGLVGCGGSATPTPSPTPDPTPTAVPEVIPNLAGPFPYEKLSDYQFFRGDMKLLQPATGVYPYQVAAALYSDHAVKDRFLVLPPGTTLGFSADGRWTFPEHAMLVKNFAFSKDLRDPSLGQTLIETRVLIFADGVWTANTYRWNEEQTEAYNIVSGAFLTLNYVGMEGEAVAQTYQIPNTVVCKNCHSNVDQILPIGVQTRQLNRLVLGETGEENQLERLAALGLFSQELPSVSSLPALADPYGEESLERRARSYLEANCAHCHQPGGAGGPSGLVLLASETNEMTYGVCKPPVSAGPASGGLDFDIVPGQPEDSILVYRVNSVEPEIKMPEQGNLTIDANGLNLIEQWISAMPSRPCQ